MDLQLMDYRNSSKCASAPPLCFRNAASSARPGSGGHVRPFNGRGRLLTNVIYRETELPASSKTRSPLQVYGQSPTDDDINQNPSLHPSIKASSNVLASSFFGELTHTRPSLMKIAA